MFFKKFFILTAFIAALIFPSVALAYTQAPLALAGDSNAASDINDMLDTAGKPSGLLPRDPRQTVAYIIYMALTLLGIVFVALVTYAGFLWLTSAGDEQKIEDAKKLIGNGIIGIVIVLSAYGITRLVFNYVYKAVVTTPISPDQYPSLKTN